MLNSTLSKYSTRNNLEEDNLNNTVKHRLLTLLRSMEVVVGQLSSLYEEHPELNDQVDIKNIIPMSIEEWEVEIANKVDFIEKAS